MSGGSVGYPAVAGTKDNDGCPGDADGDGLTTDMDECPEVAGPVSNKGCPIPDTDSDGIADDTDRCPNEAGVASNQGCPELVLEAEDQAIIDEAISDVRFASGSDALAGNSRAVLDKVVSLLNKYPNARLSIEGHTDSQGDDALNLQLSKDRAKASANRMSHNGYGEGRPIDTNENAAGRRKNRRVEFDLNY